MTRKAYLRLWRKRNPTYSRDWKRRNKSNTAKLKNSKWILGVAVNWNWLGRKRRETQ